MIRWNLPGYDIVFTTRLGGVSRGPYASLNLGRHTGDDELNVDENRSRACAVVGADPARLAHNRQIHSATVREAVPGAHDAGGDGLATGEPGLPVLALAADCLPIALARTGTAPGSGTSTGTSTEPRLVVLHAGWRGLLAGIVEAGVRALGPGPAAAMIGPAIGPCCYAVGADVSDRFDVDLTNAGKLDLWSAAERRLTAAGIAAVERLDLCTACHPDLFFSHRRDEGVTGRQGVIGVIA